MNAMTIRRRNVPQKEFWSEEELAHLKANYARMAAENRLSELAAGMGRTLGSLTGMALRLGLLNSFRAEPRSPKENGRPRQFNIIASGANVSDVSIVTNDRMRTIAAEAGCNALLKAQLLTGNHSLPPDAAFELAYRRGFIEKPMKPGRIGGI